MNKKLRKRVSFLVSLLFVLNMTLSGCTNNDVINNSDIELYDEATTLVSNYYSDIELENSLQCFYVYNYLEYNGYLSSNDFDDYKYKDMYKNNALGVDVLYTPNTTCRHLSEFYMNTLNKSGYEAYCMTGILCEDGSKNDKINHQVVEVKDNDYITYQDNYNRNIFEKNDNELESISNDMVMYPYNKPIKNKNLIATHNNKNVQNRVNRLYESDNDSITSSYVAKQYDIAYHKMMVVHADKLYQFEDEYNEKVLSKIKEH